MVGNHKPPISPHSTKIKKPMVIKTGRIRQIMLMVSPSTLFGEMICFSRKKYVTPPTRKPMPEARQKARAV